MHREGGPDSPNLAVERMLDLAIGHVEPQMLALVCSERLVEQDAMVNDHVHVGHRVWLQLPPLLVQRRSWEHRESSQTRVN